MLLERLLLGILSLGLPDQSHVEDNATVTQKAAGWDDVITRIQNSAKLHVGMLSVSLIVGLAVGGYIGYSCWTEKSNNFRAYVRNLIIALVCRIFFSILFDGVVILGSNATVQGGNTLLAFECICQNLVIAFWLMLTFYLHARMQRKFNSEPTVTLYEYGIPGVAVFFAFVWIFVMQSEFPSILWWVITSPLPQWMVSSLRLLYLLIHLGLVADMGRMMMKTSLDNDSVSLLRKSMAILAALILLFWLQFGLSLGRLPLLTSQSYQYFDYFIDGSQGGLVCSALFFFDLWVPSFLNKMPSIVMESEEAPKRTQEVLLTGSRRKETKDKVFKAKETGRWKMVSDADAVAQSRDVMYSTVVEPHRLKKTLDLYKRLNVLPNSQATVLDGEQFYDCQTRHSIVSETGDSEKVDFRSVISDSSPQSLSRTNSRLKTAKLSEQVQKKNAFYASKYLILDSKESNFPKFLETCPSAASAEKESTKEGGRDFFNWHTTIPNELVHKWLIDNSENLRGKRKSICEPPGQKPGGYSQPKLVNERDSNEDFVQNLGQQFDNENNATSHRKSGSTVKASESNNATTTDLSEGAIEHSEKDSTAKTLILTPMMRKGFHRASKRKVSETTGTDPPNDSKSFELTSRQAAEAAENSLEKEDHSELRLEAKRVKRTQDQNEYQPRPVPRQRGTSIAPKRVEKPPNGKIQSSEAKFSSNAVSPTPTPMETPLTGLPYSESTPTQFGGFSDVIYSTFTSFLNLGDGLFKSRSSVSDAETADLQVPSEREDDIHKDKAAMFGGNMTGALKNVQNLNADIRPIDYKEELTESDTKSLQNVILEEQSLVRFAREEVEEQKKPPIVLGQVKKPEEAHPQRAMSPNAETVGDESSSESNFSIEKVDSSDSSFSVDKYYAELRATREKTDHFQHPFANKLQRPTFQ